MNGKIKLGRVVSATIQADNSADDNRGYDIQALVTVSGSSVQDIKDGQVCRCDATGDHPASHVADFYNYAYGQKCVTYHAALTTEEEAAIMAAINEFIAGVEASVANVGVTVTVNE